MILAPAGWRAQLAAQQPTKVAASANGRQITFVDLNHRVSALVGALAPQVVPGSVVVTALSDPLDQWAAMLALMDLGAVPCPMRGAQAGIAGLNPALILCDGAKTESFRAVFGDIPCRSLPADGDGEPVSAHVPRPDDTAIILLSSGTTGPAKAVPLTWATVAERTALRARYFPIDGPVLSLMQPGFAGGFQTGLSALHQRLFVDISDDLMAMVDAAADPQTRHIIGSPAQFTLLVAAMRKLGRSGIGVASLLSMGGAVPPLLQADLAEIFAAPLLSMYGTTELGACAVLPLDGTAGDLTMTLLPGVAARACGGNGDPLPEGTDGLLHIRAPGMATRYLGDHAGRDDTGRFHDGWFVPGDIGQVAGAGVRLAGRTDEIVNLGGQKIDPAEVDAFVAGLRLAQDAAAFRFVDPAGNPSLIIAVVIGDDPAYATLKGAVRTALRPAPVGFFRVDDIPRNGMGKPLRGALADRMRAALAAQAG